MGWCLKGLLWTKRCQTNITDAARKSKHLDKIASTGGLKWNSLNLPLKKKKKKTLIFFHLIIFLSFMIRLWETHVDTKKNNNNDDGYFSCWVLTLGKQSSTREGKRRKLQQLGCPYGDEWEGNWGQVQSRRNYPYYKYAGNSYIQLHWLFPRKA